MKLLVSGSRLGFHDLTLRNSLDALMQYSHAEGEELVIIEGCAAGVDTQAFQWAKDHHVPVLHYPAPWAHLGKPAGAWRNRAMLRVFKPDRVITFHTDIATSKGTRDQALAAYRLGVPVTMVGSQLDLDKGG